MARPLSEAKRDAILAAAAQLVAAQGVGASTAQIAKAAKVAEGTVFTYFETKDALLNALFVRLEERLVGPVAHRSGHPSTCTSEIVPRNPPSTAGIRVSQTVT